MYIQIFRKALKRVFFTPIFWIFGLFASLLTVNEINITLNYFKRINQDKSNLLFFLKSISWSPVFFLNLILLILFFLIIFSLSNLSEIALIYSEKKGKELKLKEYFQAGLKFFWPVFFINLIFIFVIYIIGFSSSYLLNLILKQYFSIYTIIFSLIFILFLLFFSIVISFLARFALCYIIISKKKLISALEESFDLISSNLLKILIFVIILYGISLFLGFLFFFSITITSFPLFLVYSLLLKINLSILATILFFFTIALIIVFLFILTGFLGAFQIISWVLLFKSLKKDNLILKILK